MIGSFGSEVVFSVSSDKVLTFSNLNRKQGARFGVHQLVNRPGKLQFSGRELNTVSFDMLFSVSFGVNPAKELSSLAALKDAGEVRMLKIGAKMLGRYVIKGLDENWTKIGAHGELFEASVKVSMMEYV